MTKGQIFVRLSTVMRVACLTAATLLSACAGRIIPPTTSVAPPPSRTAPVESAARPTPATPRPALPPATPPAATTPDLAGTAVAAGLVKGPPFDSLNPDPARSRLALAAFRTSCPGLLRRTDQSGLTQGSDWQQACSAASSWPDANANAFFGRYFETVQVGAGTAFATGYYEPEIAGSRTQMPGYAPIFARPGDLVEVDLGLFSNDLKGKRIRGKVNPAPQGSSFVPFDERADIVRGSLNNRAAILAWAADPIEFFFLQVQGSGRVRMADGSVMRIGYDTQNGRDYTGIGKYMKDTGLLGPNETASMQGIVGWLRAHPDQADSVMNVNKSFVFFRELTGPGPLGAMGYAVTPEATVAADPKYIPLGAPILLSMDRAEPNGIWIAQDTGGAIKGANRVDTFWGAGDRARAIAGGMSARGSALLLLPIGTYARLAAANGWPQATP